MTVSLAIIADKECLDRKVLEVLILTRICSARVQSIQSADMRLVVTTLVIIASLIQFGSAQCSTMTHSSCNTVTGLNSRMKNEMGLNARMQWCILCRQISLVLPGLLPSHTRAGSTWPFAYNARPHGQPSFGQWLDPTPGQLPSYAFPAQPQTYGGDFKAAVAKACS